MCTSVAEDRLLVIHSLRENEILEFRLRGASVCESTDDAQTKLNEGGS